MRQESDTNIEGSPLATLLGAAEEFALPFLRQGREGFDIPHSRRVSHYAMLLGSKVHLDTTVLGIAGWLHDIGYAGLFESNSGSHSVVKDKKALHMEVGAQRARDFVQAPHIASALTPQQQERIVHIVGIHDNLGALQHLDEIVFMEADTLGALDVAHVTPSYDYDNAMSYLDGLTCKRMPLFRTELGKHYLERLLGDFRGYFEGSRV